MSSFYGLYELYIGVTAIVGWEIGGLLYRRIKIFYLKRHGRYFHKDGYTIIASDANEIERIKAIFGEVK